MFSPSEDLCDLYCFSCPEIIFYFVLNPTLFFFPFLLLWSFSHIYHFFSTRESLASNTSSIVESNRRQNPALSPGHMGTTSIGPPFSFRAIPEPPTTQPEKLQKSPNCLASITSVWHGPIWVDVGSGWSAMLGCLSAGGWVTPSIKHLDYMGTVKPTGMASRDCSHSIKGHCKKREKGKKMEKEISHHRIYLDKQLIRKFCSRNQPLFSK